MYGEKVKPSVNDRFLGQQWQRKLKRQRQRETLPRNQVADKTAKEKEDQA
jgi:hypothetical protein